MIIIAGILSFILSFIVASQGENRQIGFWASLFISLLFTPIIGILIVLASDKKKPKSKKAISGEVKELYDSARKNYLNGSHSNAIDKLKSANGIKPNEPIILMGLAHNYACLDDFKQTIDYIERAVECGYKDFKKIQTHDDFQSLRDTNKFQEFVKNGYKQKE
jgi:outer membrane protein assembly factor BamD (BamD/ComL family)